MKAVIPAAGLGTRFFPITKAQPKEMLPVYDRPTIEYVVKEAVDSGIDNILIITGRGKRAIEDHFDRSFELENTLIKGEKFDLIEELEASANMADIHYIRQKEQKGLGDAIFCARKFVGNEPFAVLLGDTITISETPCTKQLIKKYEEYKASIIAVEKVNKEKISSYGIVKVTPINDVYRIEDLVEKPSPEEAPSDLGIIGRYVLTPEIFECIRKTKPGVGGEIQLTDAIRLLKDIQAVYAYNFQGRRYDIGTKIDWLKSTIEIALNSEENGPELKKYLKELLNKV